MLEERGIIYLTFEVYGGGDNGLLLLGSLFPAILAATLYSILLSLYVGAVFLLTAARRFDIGFQWFNRTFDIERKPLSAIGLVASALVAVVYWGVTVGSWLLKK